MSDAIALDPYSIMVDFYDQWTAKNGDDDVRFYVQLSTEVDTPVVELGAGTGRVAIPMAHAGARVTAVDRSAAMLTEGARRAAQAGVSDRIDWVEDDMRAFVAAPPVALVVIPFRSFLHLLTVEDQLAALRAIRASLAPGGRLALNVFVPDPQVIARLDGQRVHQASFTDERGRDCDLYAENRYTVADQRLNLRAILEVRDGDRAPETVSCDLALRLVYRYEMEHLLHRAGFEVEAVYGGFDRRPLGEADREMIWIARRP